MYPWHGTWSTCCMTWCMVKGCIFLSTVSLYHVSLFEVEIHRAEVSPSTSPSRIASTLGGLPVLWLGRWNRLKFLLRTWATLLKMMKVITFCGNWSRPDNLKERLNFASEKMMRNYRRLQNMPGGRDAVGWYKQLLCQIKSLLLRKMLLYCQMLIFIAGLTFLILPAVQ